MQIRAGLGRFRQGSLYIYLGTIVRNIKADCGCALGQWDTKSATGYWALWGRADGHFNLNVTLSPDFLFTIFTQLTELSSAGCRRRFSSVSDWISERKSPRLTKFSRLLIATFRMFLLKSFNRLVAIEFQSSSSRPRSSSMHAFNRDTMIVVII